MTVPVPLCHIPATNHIDRLGVQDRMQKESQLVQSISGIMEAVNNTLKAILDNLRD